MTKPAEPIITYRGAVYPWHCDHMGHMNVTWYVGKFDEATWNLFAAVGLTPSHLRRTGSGLVAVDQRLTYKRELLAGDVVYVRSWVVEAREKVLQFTHQMLNSETDEVAAACELTGVHIDRGTRRAAPLPADILARAQAMAIPPAAPGS